MKHTHASHHHEVKSNAKEYAKFGLVMLGVTAFAYLIMLSKDEQTAMSFVESFMGAFFAVFALFKLVNLKMFAEGFRSYDLIAKKSAEYAYFYPFLQLSLGILYIGGIGSIWLDIVALIISLVSAAGVVRTLGSGAKVHCVCLGNVIKLPLSTISFVEDFGMVAMAVVMLVR